MQQVQHMLGRTLAGAVKQRPNDLAGEILPLE